MYSDCKSHSKADYDVIDVKLVHTFVTIIYIYIIVNLSLIFYFNRNKYSLNSLNNKKILQNYISRQGLKYPLNLGVFFFL